VVFFDEHTNTVALAKALTTSVEAREPKTSLLIVQRGVREDSGGGSHWRGGLGVIQEVRVLVPVMFDSRVERILFVPELDEARHAPLGAFSRTPAADPLLAVHVIPVAHIVRNGARFIRRGIVERQAMVEPIPSYVCYRLIRQVKHGKPEHTL